MLNVSSNFLAAVKQRSRTVKGTIGIGDKILTNLITNGDFSNGTTSWTISNATVITSNNEVHITLTASGGLVYQTAGGTLVVGHKYYACGWIKSNTNQAAFGIGGSIDYHSGSGNYEFLSTTLIATGTTHGTFIKDYRTSGWTVIDGKSIMTIDLTAMYGAGSEPSQAYMDDLILKVGWFNITKHIPDFIIDNRKFVNLISNGNFSNGTTYWSPTYCTLTAANNMLTVKGTGAYSSSIVSTANFNNHSKLYVRWKARCTSVQSTMMYAYIYEISKDNRIQVASVSYPVIGQWYTLAGIVDSSAYTNMLNITFRAIYPDAATATNAVMDLMEMTCIDLTATFGAGKEPTASYMNNLMSLSGWFNNYNFLPSQTGDKSILTDFEVESSFGNSDIPTIGGAVSSKLSLEVINDVKLPQVLVDVPIRPYVAIDVDGTGNYEWCKLGEYYADYSDITRGKISTNIEAFDMLSKYDDTVYSTTLTLPKTVNDIIVDLTSNYGVRFASQTGLPNPSIAAIPNGTIRQVISQLATLMTRNAVANEDGDIEFIFLADSGFSMDANNYIDFKLTPNSAVKISQLQIEADNDIKLSSGDSTGYALVIDGSQVSTQADLDTIYNRYFPLTYYGYNLKSQGMPHLQIGDLITLTYLQFDGSTSTISIPILNHKFAFNGGMNSQFKAMAPKETTTKVAQTGGSTMGQAVDQSYSDMIAAMSSAMQIITGNEGGNVITMLDGNGKPYELVIADQADINTATNVWRWNASGLIFSTDGYAPSDPTKVQIAIDAAGHINASMVATGVLNADLMKAGKLQDVAGLSWIDMTNGTFSFGGGKLAWDGTNLTIDYNGTDLESALNGKADDSDLDGMRTYMNFGTNGMKIGKAGSPQQISIDNTSLQFLDYANGMEIQLSDLSGNGSAITGTFAPQSSAPFPVGTYIEIKDCVPTVYNGTYLVTACTTSTVTATSTATGTITTLGTVKFGFVADPNAVAWVNGQKMYIKDVIATNSLTLGNHQIYKYDANITLIKYIG